MKEGKWEKGKRRRGMQDKEEQQEKRKMREKGKGRRGKLDKLKEAEKERKETREEI